MSEHDHSDFLKVDTPANACTVSDRKLREAFRASMDDPGEKVGMLDQLTARIASMKTEQKAAKAKKAEKVETPVAATSEATVIAKERPQPPKIEEMEAPVVEEKPQDEEGELFAHLNEIMSAKSEEMPELAPEPGLADSKSVIVRTFASLMPKKKAKPAAEVPTPVAPAAEKTESGSIVVGLVSRLIPKKKEKTVSAAVTEAAPIMESAPAVETPAKAPSKSVIVRMMSGLKPKPKAKPERASNLRKDQSGSIVIGILKAISPIKRSA